MIKSLLSTLFLVFLLSTLSVQGQNNTPPSCVITAPHNNAYFQEGKAMTIRVYASDLGGTFTNGTVSKVEFFNGTTKLGEASAAVNNTYSFVWAPLTTGTYTITAKATDNQNTVSTSAGVMVTVGTDPAQNRGLSACKGKYLGNIIAGSVPGNYMNLWNGITAENNTKWGVLEPTRDNMNWTGADVAYNHAKDNYLPFRYHVFAWGSQFPTWAINANNNLLLNPADFQAEMEELMAAVAARYPNGIDQIDVLNENLRTHAPATSAFREGLGGNGATGHDWIVWLFTKARQYFPNSKLILNDYGLENDPSAINLQLEVIKVLRDRNLIDGFGTQAHEFNINSLSATQLKSALDLMDNAGVPIYVTELDISGNDNVQKTRYETLFPVYWEHPAVAGVTLWGYEAGKTWKQDTQLQNGSGSDRPALTWLKQYLNGRPDVGYPFCTQESTVTGIEDELKNGLASVYPNPFQRAFTYETTGRFTYQLFSSTGALLEEGSATAKVTLGDKLPRGMYILKVAQRDQQKAFKLIKN
ncbi:endo-1,4-beta-xylanase [Rufibacter latericius]|uniref:T9SS C-terminal target domain-containing protein n=1 Tax=Rufibacter latericius TaxID=2487040 RepID=A0A3M9MC18_9BACT|nr:endo-1,4-beta-xylanase [Rufibacter latericius]RNI22697.1 T9SS C-terminal target domain-containing protein [Rufibacter latericius]